METVLEPGLPVVASDARVGRDSSRSRLRAPSHVPTGAALLALRLNEEARGIRGVDVLRRAVDRAPPAVRY